MQGDKFQCNRKLLFWGFDENEIGFHFHQLTIEQGEPGRQERTGITNYRSARRREGEW